MKARVARAVIRKVFNAVAGAVPTRTPRPILQDVLMVVGEGGEATLTGTDLEQSFTHRLEVEDAEPGVCLLPAETVRRALAAWAEPTVEVEGAGRLVRLLGPSAYYEFQTEDPALFPDSAAFDADAYHVVEARDLKRLIARTAFAADPNQARPGLAGVLARPGDGTMSFWAFDGRRAAIQVVPATREGEPGERSASIPPKALALLDGHLAVEDAPVHVALTESSASFRTAEAVMTSRVLVGRYPDLRILFDRRRPRSAVMTAGALAVAVKQAAVLADELTRSVDLRFEPGVLRIHGATEGHRAKVRIAAEYEGEPYEIRITPSYALQSLAALGEGRLIRVELGGAPRILTAAEEQAGAEQQSFVIRTDDDYSYMVAPMTVPG